MLHLDLVPVAGVGEHDPGRLLDPGLHELVALAEVDQLYATLRDAAAARGTDVRDAEVTHEQPESP